jgi:hypothetical protein
VILPHLFSQINFIRRKIWHQKWTFICPKSCSKLCITDWMWTMTLSSYKPQTFVWLKAIFSQYWGTITSYYINFWWLRFYFFICMKDVITSSWKISSAYLLETWRNTIFKVLICLHLTCSNYVVGNLLIKNKILLQKC